MNTRVSPSPRRWTAAGRIILGCILTTSTVHAATPPLPLRDGVPTLAPLLEKVTPAVVNISVATMAPQRHNPLFRDPFFRRFFNLPGDAPARRQRSAGSGVIVDAERGFVLSNHHVVARADSVMVTLKDNRRFEAEILGSDPGTDIALLRIEADGLAVVHRDSLIGSVLRPRAPEFPDCRRAGYTPRPDPGTLLRR